MIRLTIAAPAALIAGANQLALAMGSTEADANTFGEAQFKDADGNLHAVCSLLCTERWLEKLSEPLKPRLGADMEMANDVQATMSLGGLATTTGITVIRNENPQAALDDMGLEYVV